MEELADELGGGFENGSAEEFLQVRYDGAAGPGGAEGGNEFLDSVFLGEVVALGDGRFFCPSLALFAGFFRTLVEMLIHQVGQGFIRGDVFLDGGDLVARDVFGDVTAVFAALEVVVGLTVRAGADDGEVTALHLGDGDQLGDACGPCGGIHVGLVYVKTSTKGDKKTPG